MHGFVNDVISMVFGEKKRFIEKERLIIDVSNIRDTDKISDFVSFILLKDNEIWTKHQTSITVYISLNHFDYFINFQPSISPSCLQKIMNDLKSQKRPRLEIITLQDEETLMIQIISVYTVGNFRNIAEFGYHKLSLEYPEAFSNLKGSTPLEDFADMCIIYAKIKKSIEIPEIKTLASLPIQRNFQEILDGLEYETDSDDSIPSPRHDIARRLK